MDNNPVLMTDGSLMKLESIAELSQTGSTLEGVGGGGGGGEGGRALG